MDERIKFSVIIPVYNAEKYLKKCLDSVLNQTYTNYEIIIVNDGSTDNSEKIIKDYESRYSSINYIFQSNQGEFCARKTGVMSASGDYITFIDPDDWYNSDLLQTLNHEIQNKPADIVQFGINKIRYGIKESTTQSPDILSVDNSLILNYINGYGTITYAVWNKAYRSDIIKAAIKDYSIRLRIGADAYTNLLILTSGKATRISVISNVFYNYRQGSGILSAKDKTMLYKETMKSKLEMIKQIKSTVNDETIIRSIFIEISVMSKYYAYLITEKTQNATKKECLLMILYKII